LLNASSVYDVFLSYSRADAAAAEKLRARMTEAGLRAFLDRYALPAGQLWQPQLEAAIAACRALVVLLGPAGLGGWQQREIQLGLDRQAAADKATPFPVIPAMATTSMGATRLKLSRAGCS
jgi:TIR domain